MQPHPAREYVVVVFRLWKIHIAGWILAILAIGLSVAAAVVVDDSSKSARVVKLSALLSVVAAVWVIVVAQYEAWKIGRKARTKAEEKLERALATGPAVSIGFQNHPGASGFFVKNTGDEDATFVSLDPFETSRYRAESTPLAAVRRSERPQLLATTMSDKERNIHWVDFDLEEMLKDSSIDFVCSLEFTLRYSNEWGKRFRRKATIEVDLIRLNLLNLKDLPEIFNHAIEIDPDASGAL